MAKIVKAYIKNPNYGESGEPEFLQVPFRRGDFIDNLTTRVDALENELNTEVSTINETITNKETAIYSELNTKKNKVPVQNVSGTSINMALQPNTFYIFGEVTSMSLTLTPGSDSGYMDEYMFQFTSGSTATQVSLPTSIKWLGSTPSVQANKVYQVSIVNNVGVVGGYSL